MFSNQRRIVKNRQYSRDTLKLAIEILKRIPKSRKITAREIHEQLISSGYTRNIRTIQRQLVSLAVTFNLEVDDRSKPYGYKWKSYAEGVNLPTMNADEAVLLALAEKHLNNILPEKLTRSLSGYFEQARSLLLDNQISAKNNISKDWIQKVDVVSPIQPLIAPEIDTNIMVTVSNALFENNWLELTYNNAQGYQQDCRVMPLALVQQDVRLYLVCRFEGYDNERNLAIHRIEKARAQTLSFRLPKSFNLQKLLRRVALV